MLQLLTKKAVMILIRDFLKAGGKRNSRQLGAQLLLLIFKGRENFHLQLTSDVEGLTNLLVGAAHHRAVEDVDQSRVE